MKQLKMTLASLFMVLSFQGFANDCEDDNAAGAKAEMSIEKSDKDAVYRLIYLSTSEGIVSVSIYDERGTLLLTDRIRNVAGGFARPYNFSGLPSGEYTIQITDASGKTTKTLQYGEASSPETAGRQSELKVNVNALAESTRYELSVLGDRAQPVTVTIYDAQNNRIFSEQIDEPGNFRKVYNLSKVRASGGAFEVTHAGSVFQQPIR